ncbi:M24 family metallopeptidase [Qipengyuania qiaonensis]|uniref:Peptidase M24 domain-containing protein n=1 Tax=Qipengyuania qiaonensis TaxID=2867240 RepID=A0ABS7J7N8_9SPHN|nr:M24 family metallopeptidase [Qipengyuania qiaonensis]MBX7483339.1 hypothetical protein [Qipengyuania qiaonensis]
MKIAEERVGEYSDQQSGALLGDVAFAVERHAKKNGRSVVVDYCGQGIGREMHEEPHALNFGRIGSVLAS